MTNSGRLGPRHLRTGRVDRYLVKFHNLRVPMAAASPNPGPALPFRFSTPLPPAEVRASGTLTLLPVRMHSASMEAVASAANRELKEEWTVAFGKPPTGAACESPHGHLAAFALPECLPDRMYMCAYIMDYMLWHDSECAVMRI
ncbi:hypothetical protein B0H12DRAFT_1107692 [Mycena haematopus]|nr:hypothetical protein B0H12DRAFT_1107692 [Mycena haematopus]